MNRVEDYECVVENEDTLLETNWWAAAFAKMALEIAGERGLLGEEVKEKCRKQSA